MLRYGEKNNLVRFKLDASYYLQKFRHLKRTGPMTYMMFLTNLRELASRYFDAKGIDSLDKMIHCFVLEQFLNSLSDNVRQFFCLSSQRMLIKQQSMLISICVVEYSVTMCRQHL